MAATVISRRHARPVETFGFMLVPPSLAIPAVTSSDVSRPIGVLSLGCGVLIARHLLASRDAQSENFKLNGICRFDLFNSICRVARKEASPSLSELPLGPFRCGVGGSGSGWSEWR